MLVLWTERFYFSRLCHCHSSLTLKHCECQQRGVTAIQVAASLGYDQILNLLIIAGADVNDAVDEVVVIYGVNCLF